MNQNDETGAGGAFGELPADLKSFEAQLAALTPRADRLDRVRLAFLAGQASMMGANAALPVAGTNWRRHPVWPVAFAGMSALAAGLLVALLMLPVAPNVANAQLPESQRGAGGAVATPANTNETRPGMLVARDAYASDVEARLSHFAAKEIEGDNFQAAQPAGPVLRPNSWRQAMGENAASASSGAGALNPFKFEGVQS
jgi:hypothetical protein